MKKKIFLSSIIFCMAIMTSETSDAKGNVLESRIEKVKLYSNRAKITRRTNISLKRGYNKIIIGGLPKLLYDWSVRGALPKNFRGKILSLEIEKKALIEKRQKLISKIEKKLDALRGKDRIQIDKLKNIRSQENFLNSILRFTNQTASKELATRIPQIRVWDSTLNYVIRKKNALSAEKRNIEKEREKLGREIQKWEFELSQIAGRRYFRNYQSLKNAIMQQKSDINVQQYADTTGNYAEINRLLIKPSEKIDVEKRVIINIFSSRAVDTEFTITYLIPNTYWQMLYDIRASKENKIIDLFIYANIYQKTEEDWNNVKLLLSTGSPVNVVKEPLLSPWYLNVYVPYNYKYSTKSMLGGKSYKAKKSAPLYEVSKDKKDDAYQSIPETKVKEKGLFFEAEIPSKQTIISSDKYQKKYLKDYRLSDGKDLKFYYQCSPEVSRSSYLRVKTTNTTELPWLKGRAQVFLENELMGKVSLPYTPKNKKIELVLGIEKRIVGRKKLMKKYEDTSGLFGGNRKILYKYKLSVENNLSEKAEILLLDVIPVSQNEKIKVNMENLSLPFIMNEKEKKSAQFLRGIRRWKLNLKPGEKREITYDIVITFDKDIHIRGLR